MPDKPCLQKPDSALPAKFLDQYIFKKKAKKERVQVSAQINDHTAKVAGIPFKKFYSDGSLFVDTQIAVQAYYDFDTVGFSNDVYNIEAEALGVPLVYSDHVMPAIDNRNPLIKKPSDLKKLKTPDFSRDGRFPYQLEVFRRKKELGFKQASFCGPFSLAVALRSYPLLIRDMRRDLNFYRALMRFIVDEVTMPYIDHIKENLNITQFRAADAWATFPLLSPAMMEDHVLPWNLEIQSKGQEMGVTSYVFSPGFFGNDQPEELDADILARCFDFSIASMGGNSVLRIGRKPGYPLDPFLHYARGLKARNLEKPVQIEIRIDSKVLRDGPVENTTGHIKAMLDAFCPEFPVSILLSNVSVDTPPEHIHAAVQSAHYYGNLPYRFQDDDVVFHPKERERYSEFAAKNRLFLSKQQGHS